MPARFAIHPPPESRSVGTFCAHASPLRASVAPFRAKAAAYCRAASATRGCVAPESASRGPIGCSIELGKCRQCRKSGRRWPDSPHPCRNSRRYRHYLWRSFDQKNLKLAFPAPAPAPRAPWLWRTGSRESRIDSPETPKVLSLENRPATLGQIEFLFHGSIHSGFVLLAEKTCRVLERRLRPRIGI